MGPECWGSLAWAPVGVMYNVLLLVCGSYFGHLSSSSHRLSCCGHAAISFGHCARKTWE